MAQSNKRYFNTFFYEDTYVESLDSGTRFLYLTMILNPHNNLAGCYEISISRLMHYTALPEETVRAGIQKLQDDKKILFSNSYLALKNFMKNNELNPNMCKKAFDIMKASPKDKILFIISDSEGKAEPWLEDFVQKIERGINSSIDSKNRNALRNAQRLGLSNPDNIPYEILDMDRFTGEIFQERKRLNNAHTATVGGTIPSTVASTVAQPLREPSVEYKEEIEYEIEYEIEEEKEEEIGNDSFFSSNDSFVDLMSMENRNYNAEFLDLLFLWNQIMNQSLKYPLGIASLPGADQREVLQGMRQYSFEECKSAIQNLPLYHRKKIADGTGFPGILKAKGIGKYCNPPTDYNIKQSSNNWDEGIPNHMRTGK